MVRSFAEENARIDFRALEPPPYLSPLTCTAEVTLTALVKFGAEEDQYIWSFKGNPTQAYAFGLADDKLAMRSKGTVSKASSYTVPRDKWLLVTYVKGAGTVNPKFYVWDFEKEELTVVEGSVALANSELPEGDEWYLGTPESGESERFTGALAALSIWETAFSESEVVSDLIDAAFLTDWLAVQESLMRGIWFFNQQFASDGAPDWSGTQSENTGGINGATLEEDPPIPYQPEAVPVVSSPTPSTTFDEGPAVNNFIGVDHGAWDGLPTAYEFIWERSEDEGETWTPVSRNSPEYEYIEEDAGFLVRCSVYAVNTFGKSAGYVIGPFGPIEEAETENVPLNIVAPVASGAKVGEESSVTDGTWTGADGFWYGWYASPTGDPGSWVLVSLSASYYPQTEDIGLFLRARVGAYKEEGGYAGAYSNVLGPIEPGEEEEEEPSPTNIAVPVVTGTPEESETLEGTDGTWEHDPESFTYQWEQSATGFGGWALISEETANTLVLGPAQKGKYVRFRVTATNANGSTQAFSTAHAIEVTAPSSGVFMLIDSELVEVERFVVIGGELVPA